MTDDRLAAAIDELLDVGRQEALKCPPGCDCGDDQFGTHDRLQLFGRRGAVAIEVSDR